MQKKGVWKLDENGKICKITYEDQSVYEGEQKDFLKHGLGKIIYANHEIYLGEFFEDQKHGKGLYRYYNGAIYEGEWQNDKIEGKGTYTFESKERYDGRWQDNKPHGRGKYFYENGDEYDGFWEKGKQNGKGVYKYSNGSVYEGLWKEGLRHGYGILISQTKISQGEWRQNDLVKGILTDKFTKEVYNGQFIENLKRHGYGEQSYINGDKYHGYWDNDKKRGIGTYYFSSGEVVEGVWENDERSGKDVYKYRSNYLSSSNRFANKSPYNSHQEGQVTTQPFESNTDTLRQQYDSTNETQYQTKRLSEQSIRTEDLQRSKVLPINQSDQLQSKYLSASITNNFAIPQKERQYESINEKNSESSHSSQPEAKESVEKVKKRSKMQQQKEIGVEDFIKLGEHLDKITLDLKQFQESNYLYISENN